MQARERYIHHGAEGLGDAELLALVIGTGQPGRSTVDIARDLVDRFGDLRRLHAAPVAALAEVPGIGSATAVRLHAALEMGIRAAKAAAPTSKAIVGPEEAWRWFQARMAGLEVEELHGLYLDRRNRVVAGLALTRGSEACTVVDPAQVFRPAVHCLASGVIVAHNHPSGDPSASEPDLRATERLVAAGRALSISLIDHIVIGGGNYTSLAEAGHVPAERTGPTWLR